MPTVVNQIVKRVQTLVADLGADWADQDYILQHLLIVNDDLEIELQAYGLNFDTQVVVLPNVPANTSDLAAYQSEGQPLEGLVLPKTLEYRMVGQNDEMWLPVSDVQKVVDTNTGTSEPGSPTVSNDSTVESWEWRTGIIFISPCSQAVDLRIRFQSLPVTLNADSPNQPVRGVTNILTFDVVLSIDTVRKSSNRDFIADIAVRRKRAFGFFQICQQKAQQGQVTRLGSRRQGDGSPQWRSPITAG